MESLRWILLVAGAIFVLVIYLLGRSRLKLRTAASMPPDERASFSVDLDQESD